MPGTERDDSKHPLVEHCREAAAKPAGTSTAAAVAEPAPASTPPASPSPLPASPSPPPASLSPQQASRSPPPLDTAPLPAGDDWGLPENVAWLLEPGRCLGDAPPDSTAGLPLEELSRRADHAAREADAAMAAYSAARQSASQDLGRGVELVTTALAFDERSTFFSRVLVARGALASPLDPREPSSGSDAAVAAATETMPECAAAALVSEHEVRLPTPPPVTAVKGSADGSPAASPRGIPATLETAADELPSHSHRDDAGSRCGSELSFNATVAAPESAAAVPREPEAGQKRPRLAAELVALGQPPVDFFQGDAAHRTRRSRAPLEDACGFSTTRHPDTHVGRKSAVTCGVLRCPGLMPPLSQVSSTRRSRRRRHLTRLRDGHLPQSEPPPLQPELLARTTRSRCRATRLVRKVHIQHTG